MSQSKDIKPKKRILLVEDDPVLARMYGQRLDLAGYEVLWSSNGKIGMRAILTESPDLVLLDLLLPDMGGLGILQTMRSLPATQQIPAIILTNYPREDYLALAMRYGVVDFLAKSSTTPLELVRIVSQVMKAQEQGTLRSKWLSPANLAK